MKKAAEALGLDADVVAVRTPEAIAGVSALVLPGGESTTVSRLMHAYGLDKAVKEAAGSTPMLGTCAGMVLLSKEGGNMKDGQRLLELMDAKVIRNAFGRQRESFETDLDIKGFDGLFHGVFIRAPAIEKIWGRCESLCELDGRIVLARQDNLLASAFHPELTADTRIHEMLLEMI